MSSKNHDGRSTALGYLGAFFVCGTVWTAGMLVLTDDGFWATLITAVPVAAFVAGSMWIAHWRRSRE